jgi:hypothetical protein
MTRKEPTGSGGARRRGSSGHAGAQRRGHGRKRSRAVTRNIQAPDRTETTIRAEHPAAGSAWHARTSAGGGSSPLLALAADQPAAAGAILALVGAEQTTLHDALQAWGAAQDEAANRAWRRPGGLTRMAGL